MGYSVVVKIAAAGARYQEEDEITISKTGHVWLTLVNDQTGQEFNFGFHPSTEGAMHTNPGLVRTDDYRYLDVIYQRSFVLSKDQFNNIYSICQNALEQNTFGEYRGGWNACPDFAFHVLWQAGIGTKSLSLDGTDTVFDTPQRVPPWPAATVSPLNAMANYHDKFIAPAIIGNRTEVISNAEIRGQGGGSDEDNQFVKNIIQSKGSSLILNRVDSETTIFEADQSLFTAASVDYFNQGNLPMRTIEGPIHKLNEHDLGCQSYYFQPPDQQAQNTDNIVNLVNQSFNFNTRPSEDILLQSGKWTYTTEADDYTTY